MFSERNITCSVTRSDVGTPNYHISVHKCQESNLSLDKTP